MPEPKRRLSLDQLRVMSFPTLAEGEEDQDAAGDQIARATWPRCSIFICD